MLVIRGTKKLRDRMKKAPMAGDTDESTTALGDWFATALFWKPQVALLVNQRTFVPVFMPLAPAATLLDRAPAAIAAVLRRLGAEESFLAAERAEMGAIRLAPTNDRSVVGVMNEFAFHGELRWHQNGVSLEELAVDLADMPLGPLRNRSGSADRELAAVLGLRPSNVIPFPTRTPGAPLPDDPAPPTTGAHQLKVTLQGTKPPVWRRVLVHRSTGLHELHEVIQAAFGWWNHHLYEFEFGRARYGIPDPDWDFGPPTRDARTTPLDTVAAEGVSFSYTYDFGDNWVHTVVVEKVLDEESDLTLPACTDGRRACPPEDCGGPWGYDELLTILADPSHPEHAERVEWLQEMSGGPFDPAAFDPNDFEANLRAVRLSNFDD